MEYGILSIIFGLTRIGFKTLLQRLRNFLYQKLVMHFLGIFTSEVILQISIAIHLEANLNQSELIWNIYIYLQFFRLQSEMNMKAIWSQSEIWKVQSEIWKSQSDKIWNCNQADIGMRSRWNRSWQLNIQSDTILNWTWSGVLDAFAADLIRVVIVVAVKVNSKTSAVSIT